MAHIDVELKVAIQLRSIAGTVRGEELVRLALIALGVPEEEVGMALEIADVALIRVERG